jgi:thiosulfate reductase/polysulfide reductase chain A
VDAPGGLLLYPLPKLGPVEPEPPHPRETRLDQATVGRLPSLIGPPDEYPLASAGIIASVADSILNDDPYPLRAMILDGTSPAYGIPNVARQEAALKKVDFVVSFDAFLGESTVWADIVLPATTYLETWDVAAHNFSSPDTLGLRQPVVSPLGEARPVSEILIDLARRLGLDYFNFNYREFVAEGVRAWGTTLEEMETRGYAQRPFEIGRRRREGFATASGKVELYITILANSGLQALPAYERPRGHTAEIAAEYPLFLITPKLNVHTQSRTAGNPYLNEIIGENWVEINTDTAEALGIAPGDRVWVESRQGRIRLKARVGPFIHPRTVAIPHHFGHTAYNDTAKGKGANPNRIIDLAWDEVGGNTAFNDTMVKVYK